MRQGGLGWVHVDGRRSVQRNLTSSTPPGAEEAVSNVDFRETAAAAPPLPPPPPPAAAADTAAPPILTGWTREDKQAMPGNCTHGDQQWQTNVRATS